MDHTGQAARQSATLGVLHTLVLMDSDADYQQLAAALTHHGWQVESQRVDGLESLRAALMQKHWNVVISAAHSPLFSPIEALDILRASAIDLAFVMVSNAVGEPAAVAAMRAGVDDYLLMTELDRLGTAVDAARSRAALRRERREADEALRLSEAQLSALTGHLQDAKENERATMARDLHDEIGSALATINFDAGGLLRRLSNDPESERTLQRIQEQVNRAMAAMQRMMMSLRPSILDAGLVAALEWHTREFSRRSGVRIHFSSNHDDADLPTEISTAAFRVCQESLNNVLKHANASEAYVEVFLEARNLTLEIRDNGKGLMQDDLLKPTSFGIVGMRKRARTLGGWIEVSSGTVGTTVMLSLPISGGKAIH